MKLFYNRKLDDPTYYIQYCFRDDSGKVTTKNVKKIGKHSELLKITDDPLTYAKEQVRRMNEEYKEGKVNLVLNINIKDEVLSSDSSFSKSTYLNIGYFYLQEIMSGLNLKQFFGDVTKDKKNTFNCYDINRFLTYSRILNPASKLETTAQLSSFYEKPDFEYQHILRFMDILADNYSEYLSWLFTNSNNVINRDTSVVYYDCSNFYFEIEQPDDDYIDEVTGEVIKGFRKFGISKEHRPNPIVEMGLMMDRQGIPISMSLHSGNTNEQVTAIPLEQEIAKMTGNSQFIYCADAGLGSYNIRKFNDMGGRAFIVTQSIKKLSDVLQQAVFNDCDYRLLSSNESISIETMKTFDRHDEKNLSLYNDFVYKVIEADKAVDLGLMETKVLKNGSTRKVKAQGTIKQKIIVTFSRKSMEYQRTIRSRQIERAKRMIETRDPEEIKKGPNDVRRFIKRSDKDENKDFRYVIDEERIAEEAKYDGYYAIVTNLIDDDPRDIIAVANKRYQIEDCFRVMKTNFDGRPVYHRLENRIKAHFLICYTALLVIRLLEAKLDNQGTHVTTDNLIKTLKNMNVFNNQNVVYEALYTGSKTLDALEEATKLGLNMQHYLLTTFNKITKKFSR